MGSILSILASEGLDLLHKFISSGSNEAVDTVKKLTGVDLNRVNTLSQSHIQKLRQFEKDNKDFLIKQIELRNKDTKNARDMIVKLSKTDSWLLKNTGSILALVTVVFSFSLFALLLTGKLSLENPNVALIIGYLGGYVTHILSFYFGSSKNESDKQRMLNDK